MGLTIPSSVTWHNIRSARIFNWTTKYLKLKKKQQRFKLQTKIDKEESLTSTCIFPDFMHSPSVFWTLENWTADTKSLFKFLYLLDTQL